jgi:hypothetical protein
MLIVSGWFAIRRRLIFAGAGALGESNVYVTFSTAALASEYLYRQTSADTGLKFWLWAQVISRDPPITVTGWSSSPPGPPPGVGGVETEVDFCGQPVSRNSAAAAAIKRTISAVRIAEISWFMGNGLQQYCKLRDDARGKIIFSNFRLQLFGELVYD